MTDENSEDVRFRTEESKPVTFKKDRRDFRWLHWTTRWDTPYFSGYSFATVLFCVFLQGVDYSIVMPSLWHFIRYLDPNATEVWLGTILSSFSLATAVASPLVGYWFDRYRMRPMMLFLTFISFIGSMMYGLAVDLYMVLLGRIICGLGALIYISAALYVIRSTTMSERSAAFTQMNMMFAMAMMAGPIVNLPLANIGHHSFGPFTWSGLSSPGFVMAFFFFVSYILILCFFQEPSRENDLDLEAAMSRKANVSCWGEWKLIFSKFPCVVLVTTEFLVIFNQSSIEAVLTPITTMWYDFTAFENSIIFAGLTIVIVILLLVIGPCTKCVEDRVLLMSGHLITGVAITLITVFLAFSNNPNFYIPVWQMCLGMGLFVASIPFYESVLGSLFSKVLNDPSLDGRGQSVMSSAKFVASILGPFCSNLILPHSLIYLLLMMALMWFVVYVMLVIVWQGIHVRTSIGFFGYLASLGERWNGTGDGSRRDGDGIEMEEIIYDPPLSPLKESSLTPLKQSFVREREQLIELDEFNYEYIPNSEASIGGSQHRYNTFK